MAQNHYKVSPESLKRILTLFFLSLVLFAFPNRVYSTTLDFSMHLAGISISFDNDNNLWFVADQMTYPGRLFKVNPTDGAILDNFIIEDKYNAVSFDSSNRMYLLDNYDFKIIDSTDGIFFNGNDVSNIYQWPFGFVGAGTAEPVGGSFDKQGNLLIAKWANPIEVFILQNDFTTYSSFFYNHAGDTSNVPFATAIAPNGDIYLSMMQHIEVFDGLTYQNIGTVYRNSMLMAMGLAFDADGQLWVADSRTDTIFTLYSNKPGESFVPESPSMLLWGVGLLGARMLQKRKGC